MHSYLGHEGLPPSELIAIGRGEVRSYGGEVIAGRAVDVARTDDGRLRVDLASGHSLTARRVLAATGLVDELPDIDGLAQYWGGDVIHCPFCPVSRFATGASSRSSPTQWVSIRPGCSAN